MRFNPLGDTGVTLSQLGLGTVKFGRNQGVKYPTAFDLPSEEHCADILSLAQSLGITTLDTAPAYGMSEERLGRLLQAQRDLWTIIGKVGEEFEDGKSVFHFTADHFKYSLERSLKRLKTNSIDVLMIHSDGRDLEILNDDSLIKTLHQFKEQGLVKAIGASTKTAEGGLKSLELLDCAMIMVTQEYQEERAVLDYATAHNKGVILKKSLSSGHNTSIEDAFAFAFSHEAVTSAVVGTITPDHLRQNVDIVNRLALCLK